MGIMTSEEIKDFICKPIKEGKVYIDTLEGLRLYNVEELIEQPVDALLCDMVIDEATTLSLVTANTHWVNDIAAATIIRALKSKLDEKETI